MKVTPSTQACGAQVSGVDLSSPLDEDTVQAIRKAWIEHKVLAFPEQDLSDDDLVRLTGYFGNFGDEPYFVPIEGQKHVVALKRAAEETASIFAESWHSDWSFQESPPIGTCLYSITIPPVGGDTDFIDQEKALAEMPKTLRDRLEGKKALHSAGVAYAPDGLYGEADKSSDRSMEIIYSDDANEVYAHPIITRHPESGAETIYGTAGYVIGFEDMAEDESRELLLDLYHWQTREEFQYHHKWRERTFVMWDNRSVLHKANGGYDGYARELHRTTIYDDPARYMSVS